MPNLRRATALPLSSFGWSIAGVLVLSMSMPPVGFYPLAWVGLVPMLVRWATRPVGLSYAREVYALFLVAACTIAFWLLVHQDAGTAIAGGFGLFLMPLPWVAAFVGSAWVRKQYGLPAGLVTLSLAFVGAEYAVLHLPLGMPWMLLGHSQAEALPFLQIAALGGVPMLSLWVLTLNVLTFLALPRTRAAETDRWTGVFVAILAVVIALPAIYGQALPNRADGASGYTRMHVIQPGMSGSAWDDASSMERVDYLAELSAHSLNQEGQGNAYRTVVWPATSISRLGGPGTVTLMAKLRTWARRTGVTVIAGSTIEREETLSNAALLIEPGQPTIQYRQMRSVPVVDRAIVGGHDLTPGNAHTLFPTNGVKLAPVLGFEWMYGDHVRSTVRGGADALVMFPHIDQWGNSPGMRQMLSLLRLRAIENNRAVVVSGISGGSALIRPNGEIQELGPWMDQALVGLQVPIHRDMTPYVRFGDWLGLGALWLSLLAFAVAGALNKFLPQAFRPKRPRRPRREVNIAESRPARPQPLRPPVRAS